MKNRNGDYPTVSLFWSDTLSVWLSGQIALPQVQRWSKYCGRSKGGGARRQNSLQHSYAIALLGKILYHKIRPYIVLDEGLLLTAFLIHDHGEGEILSDTHYIDKNEEGDLEEYNAFVKRYSALPEEIFGEFHRAFLLQFALKAPLNFPESACVLMAELAAQQRQECLVFDAVERWDYVLYALEQFHDRGNTRILVQVMRHQKEHLDRLAEELPGFGQEVWTDAIKGEFAHFLAWHNGEHIEQKGEK